MTERHEPEQHPTVVVDHVIVDGRMYVALEHVKVLIAEAQRQIVERVAPTVYQAGQIDGWRPTDRDRTIPQ